MSDNKTNLLAVGCIARDGRIFICKRSKTKKMFPDRYELVGGHIDQGEQPEEALVREIKEEIDLDVIVGAPVYVFTEQVGEKFYMEAVYLCSLKNPTDEPTLNPAEHSESHWIRRDELDKFEKDDFETIGLRKAFDMLEGEK